jgi:predicted nucleic-acid-binding Zn-ribbon protein
VTAEARTLDARPRIAIDPLAQATTPCPKCGQTGWKRAFQRFQGNESYSMDASGKVTDRTWFQPYEYLQWTCWPCGYSFETNTQEDYVHDLEEPK